MLQSKAPPIEGDLSARMFAKIQVAMSIEIDPKDRFIPDFGFLLITSSPKSIETRIEPIEIK